MGGFVYNEKPIELVKGEGSYLYGDDGTKYLDMGASFACAPLGHSHTAVNDAVVDQLSRLTYIHTSYPAKKRTDLYELLGDIAPGDITNVWLCNSGTEANEAALKFARAATGNSKIVAMMRGFHGRTMGALATTWKNTYKEPYKPLIEDIEFIPYGDSEALVEAVDEQTAAVILEPIQGEGGINPAPEGFLQTARKATSKAGAALIIDEIQTGLGRTGELWACNHDGIVPDILTSAKGLANGLPIGATLCRDWIAEEYGDHSSTFSGNPVVATAAEKTVSTILQEELSAQAQERGSYLQDQLETELGEQIREIRGRGLMVGIEVKHGANRILRNIAMDHHILALPAGNTVVRLLPPIIIDEEQITEVATALGTVIG
jgi:acetylornithine/LysW-gamma-L-lysine aminotransferase